MTEHATVETLTDFLSSPGWTWFSAYVTREWGPSGMRYQQAVRDASQNQQAVVELQKVIAQQDAIYAVMRHPSEKLAELKGRKSVQESAMSSRRGPGL